MVFVVLIEMSEHAAQSTAVPEAQTHSAAAVDVCYLIEEASIEKTQMSKF